MNPDNKDIIKILDEKFNAFNQILESKITELKNYINKDSTLIKQEKIFNQNLKYAKRRYNLSDREYEFLQLKIKGFQIKEIADIMNVTYRSVECYRNRAYKKIGIRNMKELKNLFYKDY